MAEAGRYRWDRTTDKFVPLDPGYVPRRRGPILLRDYGAYDCPVTGQMVEGRVAHSENLKRRNCRLLEKGERKEQPRRVQESFDAEMDRILGD